MKKERELVTIQFEPSGIRVSVEAGSSILDAARAAGIYIPASCGGHSSCGKCKIRLISTSHPADVSDFTSTEQMFVSDSEQKDQIRLACETFVYRDITVQCLQNSAEEENVILTHSAKSGSPCTELPAFSQATELSSLSKKERLGAAIDIGTTTLAAYLYDLDSMKLLSSAAQMNPQIPYGDDVISRISYCNKSPENLALLQHLIQESLSELLTILCKKAQTDVSRIFETVLVGNTVMTHILLGVSPECLGHAPFRPAVLESQYITGADLSLPVPPESSVYILPAADGFIGADHLATLLSADPGQYTGTSLIIDIGTNSEICLYDKGNFYCTSCATGPALEGAMIHCGMHAATGAIDHVSIDPVTLKPSIHVIGQDSTSDADTGKDPNKNQRKCRHKENCNSQTQVVRGICGSGIIDLAASFVTTGIVDADGSFSSHAVSERIRTDEQGEKEYVLYQPENPDQPQIVITQQDIRNIQLAKAALYAGTKLLLEKSQVKKPDRILLAGAFGSYIDVRGALRLGLFPDCDPDSVTVLGNAAGAGAVISLLDPSKRLLAQEMADSIHFVDSANDAAFSKAYADAMLLPHRKDCFQISNPINWTCKEICSQSENRKNSRHPYESLEELENTDSSLFIDYHKDTVLEIKGPFSILSGLIKEEVLYKAAKTEPARLLALLKKIGDAECALISKQISAGETVFSLSDPLGSPTTSGKTLYRQVILPSQLHFLKKCRRHLKGGLIHLCGQLATDLILAEAAVPHPVRLDAGKNYIDNLLALSSDPKIRYIGPGCIRENCSGCSVGSLLEIQ